ncbi:hypothetical protein Y032_0252g220 [Ancylostoma ceylanicum]|uniref:Uncharacterized protein n=1 Tax=Ancylostoma ceylanicum TaxID=53326 RepID=A0A016SCV8_9BILA|nr:hypothetical protein Y032_0252g220 [Ancylostoma ceylanicum]
MASRRRLQHEPIKTMLAIQLLHSAAPRIVLTNDPNQRRYAWLTFHESQPGKLRWSTGPPVICQRLPQNTAQEIPAFLRLGSRS